MAEKQRFWCMVPFVFLLLSTVACGKAESPKGKELARVNDRVITLEEFNQEMEQLPPYLKALMVSPEGREDFLQRFIDRELLLQEARKKGLDKDKEILATLDRLKKGLIIEALLQERFRGRDDVSDEEVEQYYEKNKEQFLLGERVRVRHIVVRTLGEAKEIKEKLNRGEDFIELAKKHSISPNRDRGGDLGYIGRGRTGEDFERAAFSLKRRGEISDIVKTSFGYQVIRLEDRKEPRQRTFSEAQEEIREVLREKKREEMLTAYLETLRGRGEVTINRELLSAEEGGT